MERETPALELPETDSVPNESVEEEASRRGLEVRVVRKERFAVDAAKGVAPEDAARRVGISLATAYRWLQDKDVKESVAKLKGEVRAAGQRKLQRYQHEAIETVYEVMKTAKFDGDRLKAAFGILDRTGLSIAELTADTVSQNPIVNIIKEVNMNLNDPALAQQRRAQMQEKMYAQQAIEAQVAGITVIGDDADEVEGGYNQYEE